MQGSLLSMHLEAFVPIEIAVLQKQGGVTDWHIEEAQRRIKELRVAGASEALFYVDPGQTRKTMGILVECIAVLAFTLGGISVYGCRFEAKSEGEIDGAIEGCNELLSPGQEYLEVRVDDGSACVVIRTGITKGQTI